MLKGLQKRPHSHTGGGGEAKRLVPKFEASLHAGFPGDSRETPTPSATLGAPHHCYSIVCASFCPGPLAVRAMSVPPPQAYAAAAGGLAALSERVWGRGFTAPLAAPGSPAVVACYRSGRAVSRAAGGGGGGESRKPTLPQKTPGPCADGAPQREPGLPSLAHPPRHLPTPAVRAILEAHTLARTARTHAPERGFCCWCQRQQAGSEPGLRRRSSSGRGTYAHHGPAEMCVSSRIKGRAERRPARPHPINPLRTRHPRSPSLLPLFRMAFSFQE